MTQPVIHHLRIDGATDPDVLDGAVAHADSAGGPTRIDEAVGLLENVRREGSDVYADVSLYRHNPKTPRLLEAFQRGLRLFALRFTGKRVEFVVSAQPASGDRLEQAGGDMSMRQFWGEPEGGMRTFWRE